MTIFQALVLGIIQGITEFLPISSSGFLIVIPELFGWNIQSLSFDAVVHLATLAAVGFALKDEIISLFSKSKKIFNWIVFATIPVLIFGFLFQDMIEIYFRSKQVVAMSFIVWGVVLYFADNYSRNIKDNLKNVGLKRSIIIGCAQVLALVPGTSRSGITITAGLFGGLSRETATKFSFLLAIPVIAAAGLFKTIHVIQTPDIINLPPLFVGFISAFITAFITIRFLLTYLQTNTYANIAIFRVLLGFLLLVM